MHVHDPRQCSYQHTLHRCSSKQAELQLIPSVDMKVYPYDMCNEGVAGSHTIEMV